MNGPKSIVPLIGIGQAVSAQGGQTLESENTAFAENLTAALAASSLTTVPTLQQDTATPIASFQSDLVDGLLGVAASAIDNPVLDGNLQGAGLFRPAGHPDIESTGNADIDANVGLARPARSKAVSDGSLLTSDSHAAGIVNAAEKSSSSAALDRAQVGVEGLSQGPLTVTNTAMQSHPDTRHIELADAQHSELVSINASVVRPSSDTVLNPYVASDGDQPVPASHASFHDRRPLGVSSRHETAPMEQRSLLAVRAFGGDAPNVSAGVKDLLPSEVPLADMLIGGETGSARPILSTSTITGEDQARTIATPPSLPRLQTGAQHMPVFQEDSLPLQPVVQSPVRPDGGRSLQHDASSLLASRGEGVLPSLRPSAGARGHEAFDHATRALALKSDPSAPSADRHDRASVSVNEAAGKLVLGVLPGSAAQAAGLDGSHRLNTELSGFDRLQPALSVEGPSLDNLRFEAASNLGQPRAQQLPLPHAPAGAQIALQIVRSLPEGVDRFSVHLQPAELGSVDIQLNFESGGRLSALITAERPETLELLQRDSRFLERSLGDSGLKLASDGLSFALKQDHSQQQHGQGFHEQAQARQTAFRAGRAYDDTTDTEQVPSAMRVDGLRLLDIET